MSNKFFIGVISVMAVGFFGFTFLKTNSKPEVVRPGVTHEDKGSKHVAQGGAVYNDEEPATSGNHSEPLPWQFYTQEIDDSNVIHNMEHGGVYISYRPDLPQDQVDKIKALFFPPFSRAGFSASKAIMAPRAKNNAPIIMSSWLRSEKMQSFDEEKMVQYYRENIGKSPEPGAR